MTSLVLISFHDGMLLEALLWALASNKKEKERRASLLPKVYDDKVYVCNRENDCIQVFDLDLNFI